MLQIYTGNGKGKTTASLGLATRFLGHHKNVCIIQFMKKNIEYGEITFFEKIPNIDIIQFGTPDFVDKKQPKQIDIDEAVKGFEKAKEIILSKKYDMVILDELNVALDFDLVSLEEVLPFIKENKDELELVITGRYAPEELLEIADLVTEMKEIKHYFANDISAREGTEY
ncbi:MAG: cob(I)yrinic acid a,c-diamide adenosyltransferase [Candidatus Cloacimonetes bacterium]|nr:cob(I)yrinic acid a,c-diamide adenosyltransferase [Candidatus Cloacimonadota bacterium]